MKDIQKKIDVELRRPNAGKDALCNVVADVADGIIDAIPTEAPINYFYIESLDDDNVIYDANDNKGYIATILDLYSDSELMYSYDTKEWFIFDDTESYTLNSGERMYFHCTKGVILPRSSTNRLSVFNPSKKFNLGGDISTLTVGFPNHDFTSNESHCSMWANTKVVDASELVLPATYIYSSSYSNMFYNCTELIRPPKILAMYISNSGMGNMFEGCSSLSSMECLAIRFGSYGNDSSSSTSTPNWLSGVSPNGTITISPSLRENFTWTAGPSGIPEGWSVEYAVQ